MVASCSYRGSNGRGRLERPMFANTISSSTRAITCYEAHRLVGTENFVWSQRFLLEATLVPSWPLVPYAGHTALSYEGTTGRELSFYRPDTTCGRSAAENGTCIVSSPIACSGEESVDGDKLRTVTENGQIHHHYVVPRYHYTLLPFSARIRVALRRKLPPTSWAEEIRP